MRLLLTHLGLVLYGLGIAMSTATILGPNRSLEAALYAGFLLSVGGLLALTGGWRGADDA